MKNYKNYVFAKAEPAATKIVLLILLSFLLNLTGNAQDWNGTWNTSVGKMTITTKTVRGKKIIGSQFTMTSQSSSENATMVATAINNTATGTITTNSGNTLHIRWTLKNEKEFTGYCAFDKNKLNYPTSSLKCNGTKITSGVGKKQMPTLKRQKQLDNSNLATLKHWKGKELTVQKTAANKEPLRKKITVNKDSKKEDIDAQRRKNQRKFREAEAESARKSKVNQTYKVTLCKLYVYEPHVTVLNQDHEVYGIMGIRAYRPSRGKMEEVKNTDNKPARSWKVSSKNAKTVPADSGKMIHISDPSGTRFTYQGYITLNKSRTFKFSEFMIEQGAQANIQINLSEADPGIDDNFPWKQRSLEIQNMQLGKEYLVIQSEEDDSRYKIAVSFKIEKIL